MKLRVTVTPQKPVLAPEVSGLARALERDDALRIRAEATSRAVEFDVAVGREEERAEAQQICAEIGRALDAWSGAGATVHCRVVESDSAGGKAAEPVGATAANSAFQDLDAAMLQAALPKLLSERPAIPSTPGQADDSVVTARGESRLVSAMAERSAQIAMAEALRAVACQGAVPRALALRFNFGAPAGVRGLARWRDALRGLREASGGLNLTCCDLAIAVADDSVPLALSVSAAGTLEAGQGRTPDAVAGFGQSLVLLGEAPHEIAGSRFVDIIHGLLPEDEPEIDLAAERRLHRTVPALIKAGVVSAARPLAAGGLLVAVARLLLGSSRSFGARLDLAPLGGSRCDALLFGESQSRVVLAVPTDRVGTVLAESHMRGVPAALLGEVTEGDALAVKTRTLAGEWRMPELRAALR